MRRTFALIACLLLAAGCSSGAEEPPAATPVAVAVEEGGDGSASADPAAGALSLGDWAAYADPVEEPPAPIALDDARWARATAELACAGREKRGDPGAHRLAARRVLQHHRTTAEAVESFAREVNADPERAGTLGELVAQAIVSCR